MAGAAYSTAQRAIARTIREAREKAGLHQDQLAERIGRTQSYISKIEGGHQGVDVLLLFDIAVALGIEPVDLYARATADILKNPK